MSLLSNHKLKEMIKPADEMTGDEYNEFLKELRKSELFIPIQIDIDSIDLNNLKTDELVEADQSVGFRIKTYEDLEGKEKIALFTDEKDIEKLHLESSAASIFMRDLYQCIISMNWDFDEIVINPGSRNSFTISVDDFIYLFDEEKEFEDLMKEIEEDEEFQKMLKEENIL